MTTATREAVHLASFTKPATRSGWRHPAGAVCGENFDLPDDPRLEMAEKPSST